MRANTRVKIGTLKPNMIISCKRLKKKRFQSLQQIMKKCLLHRKHFVLIREQ